MKFHRESLLLGYYAASANGVLFHVPQCPPDDARQLTEQNPITVSLEFFTVPEYFNDVPSTQQCLANLKDLTGQWPPMRVGGTTQDRATYDPSSSEAVTYSVDDPDDAPMTLTFRPSYFDLVNEYQGQIHIGLNRRLANLNNTIQAAEYAVSTVSNLEAIELGNEPNFFEDDDPIANNRSWTAQANYASEIAWQKAIAANMPAKNLISAGVYFDPEPMAIEELAPLTEGNGTLKYIRDFSSHNYPQYGPYNLVELMNHSHIAEQIAPFRPEIEAANAVGKPHIVGETNSATQGGGGISPTFGAALWVMDHSLQWLMMGTQALYYHQGTIGNCQYCWWGRYNMGAPYYGAYFGQMALAGSDTMAALDDASGPYAGYVFYSKGQAKKVLLYNSDYYANGTRSSQTFTLEGLTPGCVSAKRLTAVSAEARQDEGQIPTIGGQWFEDGSCEMLGSPELESVDVRNGRASFELLATEALLVELS
ncbi:hypothetical protein MBLNU230_g5064t1 [Neophaeotheca triangularis]